MTDQPPELEAEDSEEELPPMELKNKAVWQLFGTVCCTCFAILCGWALVAPADEKDGWLAALVLLLVFTLGACWLFVQFILSMTGAIQIQAQQIRQESAEQLGSPQKQEPPGK